MDKNYEFTLAKALANLKMILRHKYHVFLMCKRAGIPFRGLLHDMSKLSPIEFYEYTKYTGNNRSPVDNCKDIKGYCESWQHHKGHNPHHAEYWIDNVAKPGEEPVALPMPYEYAVEMICDFIGAGKVYETEENWRFDSPLKWWNAVGSKRRMHKNTHEFVSVVFEIMAVTESYAVISPYYLGYIYHAIEAVDKKFPERDYRTQEPISAKHYIPVYTKLRTLYEVSE